MSSSSRSLITLQVGNYSNYIGSHWFNIQKNSNESEIDKSVLWKETSLPNRDKIWTPRLLIFDTKNNSPTHFSSVAQSPPISSSSHLDKTEKELLWDGPVKRCAQEVEQSNPISITSDSTNERNSRTPGASTNSSSVNKSRNEPNSWDDFNQWKLHSTSKTTFFLPNFSYNSTSSVISNYDQGTQIYATLHDDVEDGIRLYAEDCDYFEGFQMLVDQHNGFGGVANGLLTHISEEYEKKICFCIGTNPATKSEWTNELSGDYKLRVMNTALSWNSFNHHSSLFTNIGLSNQIASPRPIPVLLPHINYNGESDYETSGILGAALDSLTMCYRLKTPSFLLHDLISLLGGYGRKMSSFSLSFPFPIGNKTLFGTLLQEGGLNNLLRPLTPGLQSPIDLQKSLGNFIFISGITQQNVISASERDPKTKGGSVLDIKNAQSCIELYGEENYSKSVNVVRSSQTPFNLSHPFPTFLLSQNYLETQPRKRFQGRDSWEVPMMSSGHNSEQTGSVLKKMIDGAHYSEMKKGFNFQQANIEMDDYIECINDLIILNDAYSKL